MTTQMSIASAADLAVVLDPAPLPAISLQLLGGFQISYDGEPAPLRQGAQRLLAFLALHDHPLQRSYVAGSLWLETTDHRASANLRSALWRLRKPGLGAIESTVTHLRLGGHVSTDLRAAVALARRLIDRSQAVDSWELHGGALHLLAADLLPDWLDDDFVLLERERWRQLRIHALEALAGRLSEQGRQGEAIDAALGAIAAEPLRESAHRVLISVHLAEGNRSEAQRAYEQFAELLEREMGLAPTAAMERLLA